MNYLLFASTHNRLLRHDGDEFKREMYNCKKHLEEQGHLVDVVELPKMSGREYVSKISEEIKLSRIPLDHIVFFCHGTWKWLLHPYFNIWNQAWFVDAVHRNIKGADNIGITLYACYCGKGSWGAPDVIAYTHRVLGSSGFAMMLAANFWTHQINTEINAHTTSGHTTQNPYVARISGGEIYVNRFHHVRRQMIIPTRPRATWINWKKKLKGALRFNITDMSINDIRTEIDHA